jgi:hypothetical protein
MPGKKLVIEDIQKPAFSMPLLAGAARVAGDLILGYRPSRNTVNPFKSGDALQSFHTFPQGR